MSLSFIFTGRLMNEVEFSYTKGEASSGSGFKASICFEVEQPLMRKSVSNEIDRPRNLPISLMF
ncbi:hypothetical protein D3C86_1672530 [compost metagenome]